MLMRKIIIAFIFCSTLSARAQENTGRDFIIPDPKEELKMKPAKPITPINQFTLDYNSLLPKIPVNTGYHQTDLDFNGNIYNLKHDFSYMLYSNRNTLHGFGDSYEAGGMILYQPFDKLTFSLGTSVAKYSMNGGLYNDYIFSASATYRFNNWLKLHLYGQYAMNSQNNALAGGYYLSPQNCYGAMLIIKVADKQKYSIDMNIGAERSYNPLKHKWEMNYKLGPDIRLK